MIPVKNTTGRTAAVFHDEAKRTPDQHADKVTDIKRCADEKNDRCGDHIETLQCADNSYEQKPNEHNHISRFCR